MYERLARLMRFGMVGGGVTLIAYLLFLGAIAGGLHYLVASVLAWAGGLCVGFVAHRHLTFGDRNGWRGQIWRYIAVYLLQLLFGTATLAALIDLAGLAPWLAYPVNIVFTATFSYVLMSRMVFRPAADVQRA
ncbi:GtrA family protein [Sphingobium sp. Z007]|uniref:GtrA family protein n=1 Tax=Sphingobium sp. Z007 TaxID=627495 RepID=UPI000B4A233B|nr:GtrA family protein [Sphingobium sp. Z007]